MVGRNSHTKDAIVFMEASVSRYNRGPVEGLSLELLDTILSRLLNNIISIPYYYLLLVVSFIVYYCFLYSTQRMLLFSWRLAYLGIIGAHLKGPPGTPRYKIVRRSIPEGTKLCPHEGLESRIPLMVGRNPVTGS